MRDRRLAHRVVDTLESERGASFVLALLLILVCVALSSAVIAAATASSGRFAAQGEMDQRYYAVTSAAQLFRDSLGSDDELTLVFTQQRTGTRSGSNGDVAWDEGVKILPSASGSLESDAEAGYDFLPVITYYALFGEPSTTATSLPSQGFIEPFTSGWWATHSKDNSCEAISYTVSAPQAASSQSKSTVEVNSRLTNVSARSWRLGFDFSNSAEEGSVDVYHLGMVLVATVKTDAPSTSETTVDDVRKTVETRTTTVTWKLQQMNSGRGLS